MHSKFLKYFDEVVQQGSIRKAAAIFGVSPTTISRKLQGVENFLGVRLIDRTSAGIELTAAGEIVVEHCRKTLCDYEDLRKFVGDIRDRRSEHVEIISVDSAAIGFLPQVLEGFAEDYPGVTYSVTTAAPDEVMEAIGEGNADLGFSFSNLVHPDARILGEKLAPIGAIVHSTHPLAERTKLNIEDLAKYRLIRSSDARGKNSIIDEMIAGASERLTAHLFTNSLPLAKEMILRGQGIGIYTKLGFRSEIHAGNLRFVRLEDGALNQLKVGIIVSAKRSLSSVKHLLATKLCTSLKAMRLDS